MADTVYEQIDSYAAGLKLDFSGKELANLASDCHYSEEQLQAVAEVFHYLSDKKHEAIITTLLRLSRLPLHTLDHNHDGIYAALREAGLVE